jgi:hypothetical protein
MATHVVQQLGVFDLKWHEDGTLMMCKRWKESDGSEVVDWVVVPYKNMSRPEDREPMPAHEAIRIARAWRAGKIIGGARPDEVRDTLLDEVERLQGEVGALMQAITDVEESSTAMEGRKAWEAIDRFLANYKKHGFIGGERPAR